MTKRERAVYWKRVKAQDEAEQRKQDEEADLAELDRLRRYLIFKQKTGTPRDDLMKAIDDHVERMTGDRTRLWGKGHSIP